MGLFQQIARGMAGTLGRDSKIINTLRPAYESALSWASGGRGIAWKINGVPFQIDARCRIQMAENYDEPVAVFFRQRIKPGAICFDVGANVGVYVLQFANWAGSTGRVIAFEPNPAAREILGRHIAMNSLSSRVEVVPAAVGAEAGEAVLCAADADGMSRLGEPNPHLKAQTSRITVPVLTLDQFTRDRKVHPDWLLIDVEGFEIAVLRGAMALLSQKERRVGIVVELHPALWASAGTDEALALETLHRLGRRAVSLTGQREPLQDHGLVFLEPI